VSNDLTAVNNEQENDVKISSLSPIQGTVPVLLGGTEENNAELK
jgi:hypothetical protein